MENPLDFIHLLFPSILTDFEDGLSVSSVQTAIGNAGDVLLGILVLGVVPESPNPDPVSYATPVFRNGLLKLYSVCKTIPSLLEVSILLNIVFF